MYALRLPSFAVDAAHIVETIVTHQQSSARSSGAYASRITNTLINKSPNPISPAELNSHQLERRRACLRIFGTLAANQTRDEAV